MDISVYIIDIFFACLLCSADDITIIEIFVAWLLWSAKSLDLIKCIIDVDSRGEVNHICLHGASMFSRLKRWFTFVYIPVAPLCSAGWRGDTHLFTFQWRLHVQQVGERTLVTRVTPSCYPPFRAPNYFLNESSKITKKSTFLLTHFDDCFWPKIARKIDLNRSQNL